MPLILQYGIYVILGAFVGAFSGLFGVGGGIIVVPALVLIASYTQQQAQGISLAMMVPTALMGAYRYYGKTTKPEHMAVALAIAIGSVVTATFGANWAQRMDQNLLRTLFALFMVVVAAQLLWKGHATPVRQLAGILSLPGGLLLIGVGLSLILMKGR